MWKFPIEVWRDFSTNWSIWIANDLYQWFSSSLNRLRTAIHRLCISVDVWRKEKCFQRRENFRFDWPTKRTLFTSFEIISIDRIDRWNANEQKNEKKIKSIHRETIFKMSSSSNEAEQLDRPSRWLCGRIGLAFEEKNSNWTKNIFFSTKISSRFSQFYERKSKFLSKDVAHGFDFIRKRR